MAIRLQQADHDGVTPAYLRQIAAALAAKNRERLWALIDRADGGDPLLLARAIAARDKLSFLRDVLKHVPVAQRDNLNEVIARMLEARAQSLAPSAAPPSAAVEAYRAGDAQAFMAAARTTRDSLASVLLASVDAVAQVSYAGLFRREVTLLSLQFDHAPGVSAKSALHLRRDAKTTVSRPEWTKGKVNPADSPVLYAADFHRASRVVIKAKIRTGLPLPTEGLEVRALEGGILGAVDAFPVNFTTQPEVTVNVPLNHLALAGPSQNDAVWRWEYRIGKGEWRFLARTQHRVYCTPKRPNEPWDLSAPDLIANPWTAALDFACQVSNLSGIEGMDGLAAGLCELLNPGGLAPNPFRLAYTVNDPGTPHYNGPNGTFKLSAMHERAAGRAGNGELVNCDDCAGLVVTLANLLGCDLYERHILTSAMHPVIPIGEGQWWAHGLGFIPSFGAVGDGVLNYHRVAWRGNDENDGVVYDITWLVNGFADPDNPEQSHPEIRTPWYPYAEPFKVAGALDYIGRLHPASGWQLGAKIRRGIS